MLEGDNGSNITLKIATLILALFAVGFVLYSLFPEPSSDIVLKERNDVGAVIALLPAGFPSDIPVDMGGIQESFASFYEDTGEYRYLVSYVTRENRASIYAEYITYLTENNFTVIEERADPIYIYARNQTGDIEITIEETDGEILVTINYMKI